MCNIPNARIWEALKTRSFSFKIESNKQGHVRCLQEKCEKKIRQRNPIYLHVLLIQSEIFSVDLKQHNARKLAVRI